MGVDAVAVRGNVARPEEVKPAIASVAERFGKIDFLVNNAGITRVLHPGKRAIAGGLRSDRQHQLGERADG
jgi:NAD(P)-dependent dehydrogenase (short-subunit alcohol dehydrogenase family)